MPTSFTEAYREALAQNKTDVAFIETITVDHSSFPAPVRLAKSDKDFVNGPDTYIGVQFGMALPEVSAGTASNINIVVTDIDFSLVTFIDAASISLEPITVLYEAFMTTEVGPQSTFAAPLEVSQVSLSRRDLTLAAGYPDLINKKIPAIKYTTSLFPGLR